MKIQDIIDISPADLSSMSLKSLRSISAQANKATNRRISSLKTAKLTGSFAYQALPKKVQKAGKYSTPQSLTRAQIVNQIQSQQRFLRARTSTVKGFTQEIEKAQKYWAQERGKTYKQFVYVTGVDGQPQLMPEAIAKARGLKTYSGTRVSRIFELLHKLQEAQPEKVDNLTSNSVRDTIINLSADWSRLTDDKALKYLERVVTGNYEQSEREEWETEQDILSGRKSRF